MIVLHVVVAKLARLGNFKDHDFYSFNPHPQTLRYHPLLPNNIDDKDIFKQLVDDWIIDRMQILACEVDTEIPAPHVMLISRDGDFLDVMFELN